MDNEQDVNELIAAKFYLTPAQYYGVRERIDKALDERCDELADDFNFIKTIDLFLSCAVNQSERLYCAYEAGVFNQCALQLAEKIEQAEGN